MFYSHQNHEWQLKQIYKRKIFFLKQSPFDKSLCDYLIFIDMQIFLVPILSFTSIFKSYVVNWAQTVVQHDPVAFLILAFEFQKLIWIQWKCVIEILQIEADEKYLW